MTATTTPTPAEVLAAYQHDADAWQKLCDELGDDGGALDNEYAAHDDAMERHARALAAALAAVLATPAEPELVVVATTDGDGETTTALRCPHCSHDHVDEGPTVVDVASRWSSSDVLFGASAIVCSYNGDGDFEHDHYLCAECYGRVSLPDGWDEEVGF